MAVRGKPFVRVRFSGVTERRLRTLRRQARDLTPAMRVIQLDLIRSTQLNFIAEGRRDKAKGVWPDLAESTKARRRAGQQKRGAGRKIRILRDTSELFDSIAKPSGNRIGTRFVEVGSNDKKASKHQQGGNWGGSKVFRETRNIPEHTRKQKVRNKRGKLVTRPVTVRAHTQTTVSRVPARVFLWIHKKDRKRAALRVSQWVTRQKGQRGAANTRGGARGS